jgi:membrane protease subunit HflC
VRIASAVLVIVILFVLSQSIFWVRQNQLAMKFHFGKIVTTQLEPGLHFRWPFVSQVRTFDGRILTLDNRPMRFLTVGRRYLIVDFFVKWRISNLARFYNATGGDEQVAKDRLGAIVKNGLRDQFGSRTVRQVISGQRVEIMHSMTKRANQRVKAFGVKIVDVRIKGIDLPREVQGAVYKRMKSEQAQIASQLRAEGSEAALSVRSAAERKRTEILAQAYRKAQTIRGAGDAKAAAIYAKAYRKDPDFFAFYRSLKAYRKGLKGPKDVLLLDPQSEFFKYFLKTGKTAGKGK